jgi:hypothetical protein
MAAQESERRERTLAELQATAAKDFSDAVALYRVAKILPGAVGTGKED